MADVAALKKDRARLARDYRSRVKRFRALRTAIHKTRAKIRLRDKQIRAARGGGQTALATALQCVGRTERNNRAPWLDRWARTYVGAWMVGQPWCGLFCIVCWAKAGKRLPKDTVSTVAILNRARRGNGFTAVPASKAKPGDLVVFNFPGGAPAEHVGLARGPAKGGMIPTVEGNTSPGSGGSQSNGGGIYLRSRPVGAIAVVARPK